MSAYGNGSWVSQTVGGLLGVALLIAFAAVIGHIAQLAGWPG